MQTRDSKPVLTGNSHFTFIRRLGLTAMALFACVFTGHSALIGYWNFDEASGTTAFDTAGDVVVNNGTFGAGAQAPTRVPGRLGGAVGFAWTTAPNAGGRLINIPYHTNLSMNGPITISYWYRMDAATPGGTFPGIMRLGSQSTTTGNNVGWGFFRTGNMVYKRGNNQPTLFGAMNVGQWYHLALTWNGALTGNNTTGYLNGVAVPFAAVNGWSNVTATTIFELGRMDQFDTATLDDLGLWSNEALAPARVRSIYTVPTQLFLDYNIADMRTLWGVFDGAGTSNAVVKGATWSYTSALPGSNVAGDAYISGGSMYVVLGNGTGVTAALVSLSGTLSPGGIGVVGTLAPTNAFTITNANLIFDLGANTTPGVGNDLIDVTGDLSIANSRVLVDPLAPLVTGTYRLANYSGALTGAFTISNTTRYALALDDTTTNQINLTVSGTNGSVQWASTGSGAWDLSSLNWSNLATLAPDRFFQGDSVLFDDSGAFTTNITVTTPVFPRSITINSPTRPYVFTGTEQIGGAPEGITKNGASTLVLSTPNTFSGDVNVNAGVLRLGNSSALGTTNGQTIVANGATLDLAGVAPGLESVTIQGSGLNGTGAVVNTGAALNNNGLRGRVTLLGDTTFGGSARWDMQSAQVQGNGFNVTKLGNIEMYLNGNGNMGFGDVNVQAGFFTWGGNSTPGDPTKTYTVNGGSLLNFFAHTVPFNKVLVMQPNSTVQNGSGTAILAGPVTMNGQVTFNLGNPVIVSNVISGSGPLVKAGANALSLSAANTYTGRTTINAGRLTLFDGASIATSPRIDLAGGTVFDVSRLTGGYSVPTGQTLAGNGSVAGSLGVPAGGTVIPGTDNVPGTLTVTNGLALSGGTVVFDITGSTTEGAGVNDLINVGGNLDLTGVTSIAVNPLALLAVGNTYTLINYTGTLSGAESALTIVNNSRYTFSLSLTNPGKLTLHVTGGAAAELYWYGGTPTAENLWDFVTPNWSDSLGNPEMFFGGDQVIFNDFSTTNIVDLVGSLTPASMRIENGEPTFGYVLQGSGKLSGNSSLTKTFAATAVIANTGVNDYVGPTDIQGGTLQVGTGGTFGNLGSGPITNNATLVLHRSDNITLANVLNGNGTFIKSNANVLILSGNNSNYAGNITAMGGTLRPANTNALGNGAGSTVIAPGATLDVNGLNISHKPLVVAGAGVGGNGAIVNNTAGQNNALQNLTLTGDTTVGGSQRYDLRTGATPMSAFLNTGSNAYSLTKIGAGQFSIVDAVVDSALGDINVLAGTFSSELSSGAGDPTKTITMSPGATFQLWGRTTPWNKVSVFNGGRVLNGSGSATMVGPMTLNALVTFEVAGTQTTVTDPIGGPGTITKTGGGILALGGDNTYSGVTTVSAGTLQLGIGTNAGWVGSNIVMGGNTLTVYRSDTVIVSNVITSTGTLNVRTPSGLVFSNGPLNFGTINIGLTTPGRIVFNTGFTGSIGSLSAGDSPGGAYGEVVHNDGTLNVSALCRVGHWPNAVSTYYMNGGALNVTATPGGVVNPGGQPEQNGVIYLGVDGTGVFAQTGGTARAHGIVFDGRGNTVGTDTFILNGGRFNIGPSGFKSGGLDANATYAIALGGGTLGSSANWTSALNMTLTGTNGDVTLDPGAFTNTLNGSLSGTGGLVKAGSGTLRLNGTNTFTGTLAVNAGTLDGNGIISGPVVVNAGGTLSPGTSVGALRIANSLTLGGNTLIEVNKTGSVLTNDQVLNVTSLTYGGTLTVVASGDALAAGDVFPVFGATSYMGAFGTLNLPSLPSPLVWDLSQLTVNGTISVSTPRARFNAPTLSGGVLTLSGTGGSPGAPFRVLRSANVAAPLMSWTEAATGNFDGSGNFSVGITINPADPQLFYAIVAP